MRFHAVLGAAYAYDLHATFSGFRLTIHGSSSSIDYLAHLSKKESKCYVVKLAHAKHAYPWRQIGQLFALIKRCGETQTTSSYICTIQNTCDLYITTPASSIARSLIIKRVSGTQSALNYAFARQKFRHRKIIQKCHFPPTTTLRTTRTNNR